MEKLTLPSETTRRLHRIFVPASVLTTLAVTATTLQQSDRDTATDSTWKTTVCFLGGCFLFFVLYTLLLPATKIYSMWRYRRAARPLFKTWQRREERSSGSVEATDRTIDAYANQSSILNLNGCTLTHPPPQLWDLSGLTHLNLADNRLTRLSPKIAQLRNLKSLELMGNQLKALPRRIIELSQLQDLNLAKNQLKLFPSEILNLMELQFLDLSYNQLTEVPCTVGSLQKLIYITLEENPDLRSLSLALADIATLNAIQHDNTLIQQEQHTAIETALGRRSRGETLDNSPTDLALWRKYEEGGRYDFLTQLSYLAPGEQLAFTELLKHLDNELAFLTVRQTIIALLNERLSQRSQPLKSAQKRAP